MTKKHYFELGLLLQAMQENDLNRVVDRMRHLAGNHNFEMEIFPAYMLALNWVASCADTDSQRQNLPYLGITTFDAAVNFNFFADQRAKEMLADYVVENALKLNTIDSMEAHKRLYHLNDDCKKHGYSGSPMQTKVEVALQKIEKDTNQSYMGYPGLHTNYDIGQISWLSNKWVDTMNERDNGPAPYKSPTELAEQEARRDPSRYNLTTLFDGAYDNSDKNPFRGNPHPSLEEVGITFLATADKLCGAQDPDTVCDIASWVHREAKPGSILSQSAETLKRKTIARHAMTMDSFMAQAEKIMAETQKVSPPGVPAR